MVETIALEEGKYTQHGAVAGEEGEDIKCSRLFFLELPFDCSSEDGDSSSLNDDLQIQKSVAKLDKFTFSQVSSYDVDFVAHHDDPFATLECMICYETELLSEEVLFCHDCSLFICFKCTSAHIEAKIMDGVVCIFCAGDSCKRELSDDMVSAFSPKLVHIYRKNKVELQNNPNCKTCPNCHKIESVPNIYDKTVNRKIQCSACNLFWCFFCHTVWHSGINCKTYKKDQVGPGKKALKYWAKSKGKDVSNARKCPKCNFYIERVSGCDHMICSRCNTSFCYKCGRKHRELGWLGDHYSTYSFLGCKYNLYPENPILRVSIRTATAVAVVLATPPLFALAVVACVGASPVLVPVYIYAKVKRRFRR